MNSYRVAETLIKQMTVEEKINQLSYRTPAIPRLGISSYVYWNEGLHGVGRAGVATVYPQAIGLASTFNDRLIKNIATSIGVEARAKYNEALQTKGYSDIYQGITIWSPNINIFRDPRWGRGQETYGEDPYLTIRMATSYIRGLQQKNRQGYRLADSTIKHFYAHSGPEGKRHEFNAMITDRDEKETYQRAFKEVVRRAKPLGVMGAYNRVNDQLCCGSSQYIDELIRQAWNHKGYFVSDCWAIEDFSQGHHVTKTPHESALKAFKSGCDLACGDIYHHLHDLYQEGYIKEKEIDQHLMRLMKSRAELGMFDPECAFHQLSTDVINQKKHQQLCLKAAEESLVLLKNNGLLPLDVNQYKNIAVIGNNADHLNALIGNYYGTPDVYITPYQGIKKVFNKSIVRKAEGAIPQGKPKPWMFQPLVEAINLAKMSDIIILTLGIDNTIEGEENDAINSTLQGDKETLTYSESQRQLVDELTQLGKPIILVNISGSPMILPDEKMDAVIQQFYGGQYAGLALANILNGKVSPSGRLPITFYGDESQLPSFDDYSMNNRTYKYFKGSIQYPFGSGLSYTTFKHSHIQCDHHSCELDITNIGTKDGFEVVQVFAQYPQLINSPMHELVGFSKVFIKKGKTLHVNIPIEPYYQQQEMILSIGSEHPDRCQHTIISIHTQGEET